VCVQSSREKASCDTNCVGTASELSCLYCPHECGLCSTSRVWSNCTVAGRVHLSIDDAPNEFTERVLDTLKAFKVAASFWVIGRNVVGREHLVRRMLNEGHYIGSHSFHHLNNNEQPRSVVIDELNSTRDIIANATDGVVLVDHFRPPYGAMNRPVQSIVQSLGYIPTMWNLDTFDYRGEARSQIDSYMAGFDPAVNSFIILMHCTTLEGLLDLPYVLTRVLNRGYQFVSASDCWDPTATTDIHPITHSPACDHAIREYVYEGWCDSQVLCGLPFTCCSSSNWCGTTPQHCGAGCQSGACNQCVFYPPPQDSCRSMPCPPTCTCVNKRGGYLCVCASPAD